MDKQIIVVVNMFDAMQTVILVEGEKQTPLGTVSTSNLGADICKYCHINDCHKVHLFGNIDYLAKTIDKIVENQFVKQKIEIEVN